MHSKHLSLNKNQGLNLFASTQIVIAMVTQLKCATGQEEAKRDNSPLALVKGVDLENWQQILGKKALNHHLPQMQPLLVKRATRFLHV